MERHETSGAIAKLDIDRARSDAMNTGVLEAGNHLLKLQRKLLKVGAGLEAHAKRAGRGIAASGFSRAARELSVLESHAPRVKHCPRRAARSIRIDQAAVFV